MTTSTELHRAATAALRLLGKIADAAPADWQAPDGFDQTYDRLAKAVERGGPQASMQGYRLG